MPHFLLAAVIALFAADLSAYDKIEFKLQVNDPAMSKVSAVAVMDGRILAADAKANAVFIFGPDGKLIKKSSAPLKEPGGLAVGGGRVYVADTGNSRVVVLGADGTLQWAFSGGGSLPGQLDAPGDAAFGPDERLYVADTGNSRVQVFNPAGIFLYGFPTVRPDGSGGLSPARIAVDRSGSVYVSDPGNSIVVKYDRAGKLLRTFELANDGVAVDDYGTLYAINAREGKVREVSPSGEVQGAFGTRGKGRVEFMKLKGIALDGEGSVYLADEGNGKITVIKVEGEKPAARLAKAERLDRFALNGPVKKYLQKSDMFAVRQDRTLAAWLPDAGETALLGDAGKKPFLAAGSKQGQVKAPRGMTVDAAGRLYVSDTANNRVQVFGPDGAFVNAFGAGGSKEGNFSDPAGLAVSPKGNIYVADPGNRRMQAFNPDGIFLFSVGPQIGGLTLKEPVAVQAAADKNLYILDAGLKKVVVTDSNGKFLRAWDGQGDLREPADMAYDGKGCFYILDRGTLSVKIFDGQGKPVSSFFAKGSGERELLEPGHLGISDNKLYVSDLASGKVLVFALSYLPEAPFGLKYSTSAEGVALAWQETDAAWLKGSLVWRSGPGETEPKQLGFTDKPGYADSGLAYDATYFYTVASVSVTGDTGTVSAPLPVFLKSPEAPPAPVPAVPSADAGPASRNVAPMEIVPVKLDFIFSANYKYYIKNPIGRIALRNNTDLPFSNVKVSVFLKDLMDFPSDTIVKEIAPKGNAEVDLMATLNNRILNINEDTPIQCQLTMTYYQDGSEKTFTLNQPVKVLSKNAIIWDKADRLANFITPKDTPVFSFSRFVLNERAKYQEAYPALNENLLSGLLIWEGLGETGLAYLPDLVSPYSVKKASATFALDTVQFPRNTLKLRSGDCDDLTALYASLLEAAGLHVVLLDYPAHIALMFDTGAADPRDAGLPAEYLIKYENTYWAGLETTMTGKDLYDSIKHEADLYREHSAEVRLVDVRKAWGEFEPVTLPESEAENNPDRARFDARVRTALAALSRARYDYLKKYYGQILLDDPDNDDANINLGILLAQFDEAAEAAKHFERTLEKDPLNAAALNDLGNLRFNAGKYEEAMDLYLRTAKADPYDADVWLNAARASLKLGKKEDVKTYADRAAGLDPSTKNVGDKLLK